jgi:hypothetical protein
MKKFLMFSALFIGLLSCNSNSSESNDVTSDTSQAGMTNPSAIDTTKHPDGMINGSVVSTDTAAMNVQNSVDKANEAKKK